MEDHSKLLWEASKVWAPDFPRRGSNANRVQTQVKSRSELVSGLDKAHHAGKNGYLSTYSFPNGHPGDDKIPKIDSIFVDFDMPKNSEYRSDNPNQGTLEAWKRSMSALLVRSKMVARALIDADLGKYWRWSLSGHKGLHGFLDFPAISHEEGNFGQFKAGLSAYTSDLIGHLNEISGGIDIEPWLDVDSSDLARLVRHPNTRHFGVDHVADSRWCVPISTRELASLDDPTDYLKLTSAPREIPDGGERIPSERAGKKIAQHIRMAPSTRTHSGSSTYNRAAIKKYKKESNEKIEVCDLQFLTANKPCIWAFRERDDAFSHDAASRTMEIGVIKELMNKNVPVDVIVEFFEDIPGFDESYSRPLIEDIIARQYGPLKCENIIRNADQFCLGSSCNLYENARQDVEDKEPPAVTN